jgi:hypothetical protein
MFRALVLSALLLGSAPILAQEAGPQEQEEGQTETAKMTGAAPPNAVIWIMQRRSGALAILVLSCMGCGLKHGAVIIRAGVPLLNRLVHASLQKICALCHLLTLSTGNGPSTAFA